MKPILRERRPVSGSRTSTAGSASARRRSRQRAARGCSAAEQLAEPQEKPGRLRKAVGKLLPVGGAGPIRVRGQGDLLALPRQVLQAAARRARSSATSRAAAASRCTPTDCPNVRNLLYHPEREIEVEWARRSRASSTRSSLRIETEDQPGVLARLTEAIAKLDSQHPAARGRDASSSAAPRSRSWSRCANRRHLEKLRAGHPARLAGRAPGRAAHGWPRAQRRRRAPARAELGRRAPARRVALRLPAAHGGFCTLPLRRQRVQTRMRACAVDQRPHALQVGLPGARGDVVGVADLRPVRCPCRRCRSAWPSICLRLVSVGLRDGGEPAKGARKLAGPARRGKAGACGRSSLAE